MSVIQKSLEELNQSIEAFKEKYEKKFKDLEDRALDPLAETRIAKINEEMDKINQNAHERARNFSLARPSLSVSIRQEIPEGHRQAFLKFLLNGQENELRNFEQKRMDTFPGAEGGFFLPSIIDEAFRESVKTLSPMRSIARVVETKHQRYELVLDDDTRDLVAWGDPIPAYRVDGTPTPHLEKRIYPVFSLVGMPRIASSLLDDTPDKVEEWLVDNISSKMARKENRAFINGDGLTQPEGILTRAFSTVEEPRHIQVIRTGRDGQFPAERPDEALINLVYSLRPEYLSEAVWLMSRSALAEIRKMKGNDGHYLWHPDVEASGSWKGGGRLLGYSVVVSDDMPPLVPGTPSVSVLFGNFKEGYLIVDRQGINVLRDPYTSKPDIDLLVRCRVGGGVRDYRAIKGLQFAKDPGLPGSPAKDPGSASSTELIKASK